MFIAAIKFVHATETFLPLNTELKSEGMVSLLCHIMNEQVGGSTSSIYPADFGDIDVQGNIQFAVNYIQKLGEFHIFVVHCRELAIADTKKNRSDP